MWPEDFRSMKRNEEITKPSSWNYLLEVDWRISLLGVFNCFSHKRQHTWWREAPMGKVFFFNQRPEPIFSVSRGHQSFWFRAETSDQFWMTKALIQSFWLTKTFKQSFKAAKALQQSVGPTRVPGPSHWAIERCSCNLWAAKMLRQS
jgi:hypothetical protein